MVRHHHQRRQHTRNVILRNCVAYEQSQCEPQDQDAPIDDTVENDAIKNPHAWKVNETQAQETNECLMFRDLPLFGTDDRSGIQHEGHDHCHRFPFLFFFRHVRFYRPTPRSQKETQRHVHRDVNFRPSHLSGRWEPRVSALLPRCEDVMDCPSCHVSATRQWTHLRCPTRQVVH